MVKTANALLFLGLVLGAQSAPATTASSSSSSSSSIRGTGVLGTGNSRSATSTFGFGNGTNSTTTFRGTGTGVTLVSKTSQSSGSSGTASSSSSSAATSGSTASGSESSSPSGSSDGPSSTASSSSTSEDSSSATSGVASSVTSGSASSSASGDVSSAASGSSSSAASGSSSSAASGSSSSSASGSSSPSASGSASSTASGDTSLTTSGTNSTTTSGGASSTASGDSSSVISESTTSASSGSDSSSASGTESSSASGSGSSSASGTDSSSVSGTDSSSSSGASSTTSGASSSENSGSPSSTPASPSSTASGNPPPTTTGGSSPSASNSPSTSSNYVTAPFVVGGSITVPAQTAVESGQFSTITPDITGPPNSYTVTTTTGSDHKTTILPIWFGSDGLPILKLPLDIPGPAGIIPPPPGFPTIQIGPDGQPTEKNNDDQPTSDPKTTDSPTSTNSDSTESDSSTSSSTSCTQSAVTQEVVSCLTAVGGTATGTLSCTTITSTVTGCQATGLTSTTISTTTATSTGTPTNYLIIAQTSASSSDKQSFASTLQDQVGKDKVQSADDDSGTVFWYAPLNSTQVKDFQSSSAVVSAIISDATLEVEDIGDASSGSTDTAASASAPTASKRAYPNISRRNQITQYDALDELKVISQGQGTPLSQAAYEFDSSSGGGVTVYVVDTGANKQSPDYINTPGNKRWLFSGFTGVAPEDTDEDDKIGHGSCVFSKAVGYVYGVVKAPDVVIVKLQGNHLANNGFNIPASNLAKVLIDVNQDIQKNKLQNKAVINMSFGVKYDANDPYRSAVEGFFQKITAQGVPVVAAAGNEGPNGQIDTYPQLYADNNNGIIVVGSTNNDGVLSSFSSRGPQASIFAPGEKITCAAGSGTGTQVKDGTSFAAPAVAGLAAYFMAMQNSNSGTGQTLAENIKSHLVSLAYPRQTNAAEKVAWNGISGALSCQANNPKRDGSCQTAQVSTFATSVIGTSPESNSPSSAPTSSPSSASSALVTSTDASSDTTTSAGPTDTTSSDSPPTTTSDAPITTSTDSPTTTSDAPTSATTSENLPSCSPTTGTSLIQSKAATNIGSFCSYVVKNGLCQSGDHITLTSDLSICNGNPYVGAPYYDTGNTMNVKVTLSKGDSYNLTESDCNTAFLTVLNGCAPFSAPSGQDFLKYGGSIVWANNGAEANFSISAAEPQAIS